MRNSTLVVVILLVVVAGGFFFLGSQFGGGAASVVSTTTDTGPTDGTGTTGSGPVTGSGNWQVFENALLSIRYPDVFVVNPVATGDEWRSGANGDAGTLDFRATLPKSFAPGTNFSDAKLTVGHSANATTVADCMKPDPSGGPASSLTTRVINGTTFTVFTSSDAGAGNLYDTTSYRTVHQNTCIAVEYTIHYTQIANYPPGAVTEFDEAAVKAELDAVVDTATLK
ncbi:MAG TPA: hypothetical protein VHC20_02995 [Candidatus Paceibacterota bacterium]|nr:hypothetical protein [Candidatus Paceibacterota bacterium]